jgi:hypothetical protein
VHELLFLSPATFWLAEVLTLGPPRWFARARATS